MLKSRYIISNQHPRRIPKKNHMNRVDESIFLEKKKFPIANERTFRAPFDDRPSISQRRSDQGEARVRLIKHRWMVGVNDREGWPKMAVDTRRIAETSVARCLPDWPIRPWPSQGSNVSSFPQEASPSCGELPKLAWKLRHARVSREPARTRELATLERVHPSCRVFRIRLESRGRWNVYCSFESLDIRASQVSPSFFDNVEFLNIRYLDH